MKSLITRILLLLAILVIPSCVSYKEVSKTVIPYPNDRFLIITADDFGASENINEGIRLALSEGFINTVSALTNFSDSMDELKKLSIKYPDVGIGVHLNITTGKPIMNPDEIPSLVNKNGNFYPIEELLIHVKSISLIELRKELKAQIDQLIKYDIDIDHLSNQHGILSLYSPFYDVVINLAEEYDVPARCPIAVSIKYPEIFPKAQTRKRGFDLIKRLALRKPFKAFSLFKYGSIKEMENNMKKLENRGIQHPNVFIDYLWGNPSGSNIIYILENLPVGISEIVLHLGSYHRETKYPTGLDQSYFKKREFELLLATSEYLKKYINHLNIKIINYSDIKYLRESN